MTDRTDAIVADQYEAYPYPARDPKDETQRLVVGSPSHLAELGHWVFGARRGPERSLNALIAGGGTGDACVMLATRLARAGRPGQVTWLDRSAAAGAIARKRAEARGLTNVTSVRGSLLDLPSRGLGPFDYIDCRGELHHSPDPAAGPAAPVSVLAPGGGLGLMVHAPHGRTGVSMAQNALRCLAPPDLRLAERVEIARRFVRALHPEHWLARNARPKDHIAGGDAGIVDPQLHARDRPYTVPELLALRDGAELAVQAGAGGRLGFNLDGVSRPVALPPLGAAILRRIDGRMPLGAVLAGIEAPAERARREWAALHAALKAMNRRPLAAPPGG